MASRKEISDKGRLIMTLGLRAVSCCKFKLKSRQLLFDVGQGKFSETVLVKTREDKDTAHTSQNCPTPSFLRRPNNPAKPCALLHSNPEALLHPNPEARQPIEAPTLTPSASSHRVQDPNGPQGPCQKEMLRLPSIHKKLEKLKPSLEAK